MGLGLSPEVRMARKILEKHKLTIPFDLTNLVSKYAKILYKSIPIDGVDGICVNLKKLSKTPLVIVNNNASSTRQKFTLAHELGHIIIPWHLGTIIDDIDVDDENSPVTNQLYWELEREANRFASELLIPFDYIFKQFKLNPDPDSLIEQIKLECGVSDMAARIRLNHAITEISDLLMPEENIRTMSVELKDLSLIQYSLMNNTPFNSLFVARHMVKYLAGKIAFCVESNGIVEGCGGTSTTKTYYQQAGETFQSSPYLYFDSYNVHETNQTKTHWWSLDVKLSINEDIRDWREILNKIAVDLKPTKDIEKFKKSINGKLSGLNSQRIGKNRYSEFDIFLEEVIHRFNTKEYEELVGHPDFLAFIKNRSKSLFRL